MRAKMRVNRKKAKAVKNQINRHVKAAFYDALYEHAIDAKAEAMKETPDNFVAAKASWVVSTKKSLKRRAEKVGPAYVMPRDEVRLKIDNARRSKSIYIINAAPFVQIINTGRKAYIIPNRS